MNVQDFAVTWLPNLIAFLALGYAVRSDLRGARKGELDAINQRIDGVEEKQRAEAEAGRTSREKVVERLTVVEGQLSHLPDKETVHRLEVAVATMGGDIKAQGASMVALNESVKAAAVSAQRIETYLLEAKK
jgi:hypothetical protein